MARSFNGTTDKINCGNFAQFPSGALVVMSGSIWVYPTSFPNAYNTPIGKDDGTNFVDLFVKSTGKLAFYYTDGAATSRNYDGTGTNTLSANTWYNLTFTIASPGVGTVYVNGSADGNTGASTNGIHSNTSAFFFGTANSASFWAGRCAHSGLWNVVLTTAEITALANGALPYAIRPGSLIGYWPLDGLQSPEPDLSGNKNNGTLTGTALAFGAPNMQFTPRWPQRNFAAVAAAAAKARHNLNMPLPW